MRILVTGASGFIGRQMISPLLERGFEVHGAYSHARKDLDPRIQWHECDLLREGAADALCAQLTPTHLLHLAWYVNPADYKTSPENERWVPATLSLLKAFGAHGGKRAVLTGTCMEYDWSTGAGFLREDAPTASLYAYSKAKNEARELSIAYAKDAGLSLAWGRIFNVFGPHEGKERLISQSIAAIIRGESPQVRQGVTLDYTYVVDVARAFIMLVDSQIEGIVNVASGVPLSLEEIANAVAATMGRSDIHAKLLETDDPPERVVADITRLTEELGFQPEYSLRKGLQATVTWWPNATGNASS